MPTTTGFVKCIILESGTFHAHILTRPGRTVKRFPAFSWNLPLPTPDLYCTLFVGPACAANRNACQPDRSGPLPHAAHVALRMVHRLCSARRDISSLVAVA